MIPRCNGITQPILRLFGHTCSLLAYTFRFLVAKGVNADLQDEVVSLVLPDEKFTIFASLGIQKNSEFANTFDFGLMKQAETGAQR